MIFSAFGKIIYLFIPCVYFKIFPIYNVFRYMEIESQFIRIGDQILYRIYHMKVEHKSTIVTMSFSNKMTHFPLGHVFLLCKQPLTA